MINPPLRRDVLRLASVGAIPSLMGCLADSDQTPSEGTTITTERGDIATERTESTTTQNRVSTTPPTVGSTRFSIWPEDDLTLTIRIREFDSDRTIYDETMSLEAAEELVLEDVFEKEPYKITLLMGGELIWQQSIETCEHLKISVADSESVEVVKKMKC